MTATTAAPPLTPREAKSRFYAKYSDRIGGATIEHVGQFLGRTVVEPITTEGWISLAEEVRDTEPPAAASPRTPPRLGFSFRTRARIGDAEGELTITADALRDLVLTVRQLGSVGAVQLAPQAQAWHTTPDGRPICPRHRTPMKQREKQGDVWYSHNVGTEDEPCYCKGYPGPDSPGWDR